MRAIVREFALQMEVKLQENDHKEHWENVPVERLVNLLEREVWELKQALKNRGDKRAITREAADIANFAMMIADVAGDLPDCGRRGIDWTR